MAGPGIFARFAHKVSDWVGRPVAFAVALVAVVVWAVMGPPTGYSDTWQLTINTATTIATFLMVFVIQNTQNRQDLAIQLKLDELLRTMADSALIDLEDVSDEEIGRMRDKYRAMADRRRNGIED